MVFVLNGNQRTIRFGDERAIIAGLADFLAKNVDSV
jgi:hypothetical protein